VSLFAAMFVAGPLRIYAAAPNRFGSGIRIRSAWPSGCALRRLPHAVARAKPCWHWFRRRPL